MRIIKTISYKIHVIKKYIVTSINAASEYKKACELISGR